MPSEQERAYQADYYEHVTRPAREARKGRPTRRKLGRLGPDHKELRFKVPPDLHAALEASAIANDRSINHELVAVLSRVYGLDQVGQVLAHVGGDDQAEERDPDGQQ